MPDTPPGSGVEEPDAGGTQQPDDATKSLDVPEWVSELRRLYVEPQTRAKLRQEGAIAPQKRKLGLPGLRGSRRSGDGNGDERAGGAHSARSHSEPAEPTDVSQPAPTTPHEPIFTSIAAVPPGQVPPAQPDPAFDGDGVAGSDPSTVEPQPMVEEQVGAWLNSYLVATGHAADDGRCRRSGRGRDDRRLRRRRAPDLVGPRPHRTRRHGRCSGSRTIRRRRAPRGPRRL